MRALTRRILALSAISVESRERAEARRSRCISEARRGSAPLLDRAEAWTYAARVTGAARTLLLEGREAFSADRTDAVTGESLCRSGVMLRATNTRSRSRSNIPGRSRHSMRSIIAGILARRIAGGIPAKAIALAIESARDPISYPVQNGGVVAVIPMMRRHRAAHESALRYVRRDVPLDHSVRQLNTAVR